MRGELREGEWSAWDCRAGDSSPGMVCSVISALLHHPLSMCQNELSGDMTAGTAGSRGACGFGGGRGFRQESEAETRLHRKESG